MESTLAEARGATVRELALVAVLVVATRACRREIRELLEGRAAAQGAACIADAQMVSVHPGHALTRREAAPERHVKERC